MGQEKVAMIISGPWAWSNLLTSGIDFGLAPVPGVDGKPGPSFYRSLGGLRKSLDS